jgi:membrane-associated protein
MAGVGKMKFVDFFRYNLIGGALWTVGISSLGYFLGRSIPNIDHYLLPIIALIIIISFLPPFFQYLKWRKDKAKI